MSQSTNQRLSIAVASVLLLMGGSYLTSRASLQQRASQQQLASSLIMQTSSVMMQLFDLEYSSYEGMFSFGMGMQ